MEIRYKVRVTRDGRFWLVAIPDIDGLTQARTLNEVEIMALDYIAITQDIDPESIVLDVQIELPTEVNVHLAAARQARKEEAAARKRAADEYRRAAKALRKDGATVREIGVALGISHQRAQQLTHV